MDFYINLFAITLIATMLELFKIKKFHKLIIIYLLAMIYIFLSATRWSGLDWQMYYDFFLYNNSYDDFVNNSLGIDFGYGIINYLVKSFTDEYSVLISILAIIIISIKVNFILKFAMFPLLTMFYWFGTYMGDIFFIRQTLAVAITLIAFRFIVKKNFLLFLLFTCLAACIQISTIFFIPAYFLFYKKIKIRYLVLILIITCVIGQILDSSILTAVSGVINIFPDGERLGSKIELYTYFYDNTMDSEKMLYGILRRMIFLPLELYFINKIEKYDANYRGYINLIVFGNVLYFLFGNISPVIAGRINLAYNFYEVLVIPIIFITYKSFKIRILLFICFVIFVFAKYMFNLYDLYEQYVPYINILIQ